MDDSKQEFMPNVLSDVLLAEYVLKPDSNSFFKLDERWNSANDFADLVVLYKIALVLAALLSTESTNKDFLQVRLHFEKAVFTDGKIEKLSFYYSVKSAMDNLGELLDLNEFRPDDITQQERKFPWSMACLRKVGIIKKDQTISRSQSVIGMGWSIAWLEQLGITETNPVTLSRFALMWMDNYIAIRDFLRTVKVKTSQ